MNNFAVQNPSGAAPQNLAKKGKEDLNLSKDHVGFRLAVFTLIPVLFEATQNQGGQGGDASLWDASPITLNYSASYQIGVKLFTRFTCKSIDIVISIPILFEATQNKGGRGGVAPLGGLRPHTPQYIQLHIKLV